MAELFEESDSDNHRLVESDMGITISSSYHMQQ